LEDEHWSVRCAAATALGRVRSYKAVPPLPTRLDDDDATVRRAVVAALGEIGDARAGRRLTQLLSDPALEPAALEPARLTGRSAVGEVERAFAGAAPDVRRLIVDLVGKLEDRQGRRLLLA